MEPKEVAAAILTKIAFDHNSRLQTDFSGISKESAVEEVIKVYMDCLNRLKK